MVGSFNHPLSWRVMLAMAAAVLVGVLAGAVVVRSAGTEVQAAPGKASGFLKARLVSDERHAAYEKLWPKLEGFPKDVRDAVIYYDDSVMPAAYQDFVPGGVHGIFDPNFNISGAELVGRPPEKFGNANKEFPWKSTAGLDETTNARSIKFMCLPSAVKWHRQDDGWFRWVFPDGAVLGELLVEKDADDREFVFEIRTRTKISSGKWSPDVYRPFPTHDALKKAVAGKHAGQKDKDWYRQVMAEPVGEYWKYKDVHSVFGVAQVHFEQQYAAVTLPGIPQDVVKTLLTSTPFRSVIDDPEGESWAETKAGTVYAPGSKQKFNLVPGGYDMMAPVTTVSCARCHADTLKLASEIEAPRDWYAAVRGDDNILSFHIFDPDCVYPLAVLETPIGNGGTHRGPKQPAISTKLVKAGLLEESK